MTFSIHALRRELSFVIEYANGTATIDGTIVDLKNETRPFFGIIDAMTKEEREFPEIINDARRRRIALGAGVDSSTVTELISMFFRIRNMKASFGN